jgi:hypothetical protein
MTTQMTRAARPEAAVPRRVALPSTASRLPTVAPISVLQRLYKGVRVPTPEEQVSDFNQLSAGFYVTQGVSDANRQAAAAFGGEFKGATQIKLNPSAMQRMASYSGIRVLPPVDAEGGMDHAQLKLWLATVFPERVTKDGRHK